jgi:hypothetical protein
MKDANIWSVELRSTTTISSTVTCTFSMRSRRTAIIW